MVKVAAEPVVETNPQTVEVAAQPVVGHIQLASLPCGWWQIGEYVIFGRQV